jgi:hypothetical protein
LQNTWEKQADRRNGQAARDCNSHGRGKSGFETIVYMGAKDVKRQQMNAYRMELMGTEVKAVHAAQKPSRMQSTRLSETGLRT